MRKISYLLILFILVISCGCQLLPEKSPFVPKEEETEEPVTKDPLEPTVGEVPTEKPIEPEYNEPADSVEGIDVSDLSKLKEAFDNVGYNYASETHVYFNSEAISQVYDLFGITFVSNQKACYTENYIYRYTDSFSINTAYINRNNNVYGVSLTGDSIKEKFTNEIKEDNLNKIYENDNLYNYYFSINSLNSEYVDTYGPTSIKYSNTLTIDYLGWTRIGENKYKCDRMEIFKNFISICAPSYPLEDGAYMTFSHVTVEIAPDADTYLRIRLYASETQTGKLISSHLDAVNKPNWYLLFAEAYINNVGNANIASLENIK